MFSLQSNDAFLFIFFMSQSRHLIFNNDSIVFSSNLYLITFAGMPHTIA